MEVDMMGWTGLNGKVCEVSALWFQFFFTNIISSTTYIIIIKQISVCSYSIFVLYWWSNAEIIYNKHKEVAVNFR